MTFEELKKAWEDFLNSQHEGTTYEFRKVPGGYQKRRLTLHGFQDTDYWGKKPDWRTLKEAEIALEEAKKTHDDYIKATLEYERAMGLE